MVLYDPHPTLTLDVQVKFAVLCFALMFHDIFELAVLCSLEPLTVLQSAISKPHTVSSSPLELSTSVFGRGSTIGSGLRRLIEKSEASSDAAERALPVTDSQDAIRAGEIKNARYCGQRLQWNLVQWSP